jgi:dTDP-6-deoxy-L-talose 4-dehydrogenase (NAD+)
VKKILVTGATGFIGNYVIKELLRKNCVVIATSADGKKAQKTSWFSQVRYIPFNLSDFNDNLNYYLYFEEPDLLIHLAWEGLPNYTNDFHIVENLPRHIRFLKNLVKNGLNDMTMAGTCFEYGMKEGCLSEEMECIPVNSYAKAKNLLRKELELLQSERFFYLKWVRLFYMYGKGQHPNSLISQLERAIVQKEKEFKMSGGEQLRDFLAVTLVARYIVAIALQRKVTGVINCCSGKPVSVKSFVENYLKETDQFIPLKLGFYPYADYEPMMFWGDNTKLKLILNND